MPAHYRHDGVRIQHDPYAPGMAEKYGTPGNTDDDGFDPYADSVGAGIYGGTVKRRASDGGVVITTTGRRSVGEIWRVGAGDGVRRSKTHLYRWRTPCPRWTRGRWTAPWRRGSRPGARGAWEARATRI